MLLVPACTDHCVKQTSLFCIFEVSRVVLARDEQEICCNIESFVNYLRSSKNCNIDIKNSKINHWVKGAGQQLLQLLVNNLTKKFLNRLYLRYHICFAKWNETSTELLSFLRIVRIIRNMKKKFVKEGQKSGISLNKISAESGC